MRFLFFIALVAETQASSSAGATNPFYPHSTEKVEYEHDSTRSKPLHTTVAEYGGTLYLVKKVQDEVEDIWKYLGLNQDTGDKSSFKDEFINITREEWADTAVRVGGYQTKLIGIDDALDMHLTNFRTNMTAVRDQVKEILYHSSAIHSLLETQVVGAWDVNDHVHVSRATRMNLILDTSKVKDGRDSNGDPLTKPDDCDIDEGWQYFYCSYDAEESTDKYSYRTIETTTNPCPLGVDYGDVSADTGVRRSGCFKCKDGCELASDVRPNILDTDNEITDSTTQFGENAEQFYRPKVQTISQILGPDLPAQASIRGS